VRLTRGVLHRARRVFAGVFPRRGLAALLVGLAALGSAAGATGCAGETASRVATGQPVATGNAEFDAFFKQVDELRAEAAKADEDEATARLLLVRALALPEEAGADATVKAAGERAKKLLEAGLMLHLELTPEAKLVTRGKGGDAGNEAAIKAIEEAAKSSLALVRRMADIEKRSADLQNKRRELRLKTRSELGARAEEIERELGASEQVIAEAAELGSKSAGSASQFVLELAGAVETGAGGPAAPTRVAVVRGGGKGAGKATKKAAKSPGSSGGSAAPPPPKKPKSDDFEP
jgi:hypothetical protein